MRWWGKVSLGLTAVSLILMMYSLSVSDTVYERHHAGNGTQAYNIPHDTLFGTIELWIEEGWTPEITVSCMDGSTPSNLELDLDDSSTITTGSDGFRFHSSIYGGYECEEDGLILTIQSNEEGSFMIQESYFVLPLMLTCIFVILTVISFFNPGRPHAKLSDDEVSQLSAAFALKPELVTLYLTIDKAWFTPLIPPKYTVLFDGKEMFSGKSFSIAEKEVHVIHTCVNSGMQEHILQIKYNWQSFGQITGWELIFDQPGDYAIETSPSFTLLGFKLSEMENITGNQLNPLQLHSSNLAKGKQAQFPIPPTPPAKQKQNLPFNQPQATQVPEKCQAIEQGQHCTNDASIGSFYCMEHRCITTMDNGFQCYRKKVSGTDHCSDHQPVPTAPLSPSPKSGIPWRVNGQPVGNIQPQSTFDTNAKAWAVQSQEVHSNKITPKPAIVDSSDVMTTPLNLDSDANSSNNDSHSQCVVCTFPLEPGAINCPNCGFTKSKQVISPSQELARGGMKIVYLRTEADGTQVVYKEASAHSASMNLGLANEKLEFEVELLQTIGAHKRIPRLIEHGQIQSATGEMVSYLVEEYIEGGTLTEAVNKARESNYHFNERKIIHWMIALCEPLMYCANLADPIYHRDIKPDNIIIHPTRGPIIIDWGVGKIQTGDHGTTSHVFSSGAWTPPERRTGTTGPFTDVYSLGKILSWLILTETSARGIIDHEDIPDFKEAGASEELARLVIASCKPKHTSRISSVQELYRRLCKLDPDKRAFITKVNEALPDLPMMSKSSFVTENIPVVESRHWPPKGLWKTQELREIPVEEVIKFLNIEWESHGNSISSYHPPFDGSELFICRGTIIDICSEQAETKWIEIDSGSVNGYNKGQIRCHFGDFFLRKEIDLLERGDEVWVRGRLPDGDSKWNTRQTDSGLFTHLISDFIYCERTRERDIMREQMFKILSFRRQLGGKIRLQKDYSYSLADDLAWIRLLQGLDSRRMDTYFDGVQYIMYPKPINQEILDIAVEYQIPNIVCYADLSANSVVVNIPAGIHVYQLVETTTKID